MSFCGARKPIDPPSIQRLNLLTTNRDVQTDANTAELDHVFMRKAIDLARAAEAMGEVPVGAVVVKDQHVIAQAFNLRETTSDPCAHAERLAMSIAGKALNSWRLDDCTLYVTLEPCVMCAGAVVLARLPRLVYGALDPKAGACASLYRICDDPRLNHRPIVTGGVLAGECGDLLSTFFREKRTTR